VDAPKEPRSGAIALGGVALIGLGLWWLARGFIPQQILDLINRSAGALTLVGLGVVVIVLSRRAQLTMPRSGARLYRSRTDRMLGGVLGGLGTFLGVDPLVLRIAVVLLTLLGASGLVAAYIVMWVLVPEEPLPAPGYTTTTIPPAPPVPPTPGA
jgi:phage shock protein PspC (stress-responsive transcriptional regulator)